MNSGGYSCEACGKFGMTEFEKRTHGCAGKNSPDDKPNDPSLDQSAAKSNLAQNDSDMDQPKEGEER